MIEKLKSEPRHDFTSLCDIMALLRSEGGCPWDREQTHESIRSNFIEETYEVVEAIDNGDAKLLREELGDVLLQVVFHARMEEERGAFDINDVANDICAKLIHRHPHIFGDVVAETPEAVLANWDRIKAEEKKRDSASQKMRAIPPALPALMRAQKVGERAAKCGFDFDSAAAALEKVREETAETAAELERADEHRSDLEGEIGDLLFSVVNTARLCGVDAESALNRSTAKFIERFEALERAADEEGLDMEKAGMQALDSLWEKVKKARKNN
jgi:tetrapyrrole methylase family protein/MazG family protein